MAAVVVLVLAGLYGAALVRGSDAPRLGASLAELQRNADDIIGERWVVSGEVSGVFGDELLLIGGERFGTRPLPVLLTDRALEIGEARVGAGAVGQFVGRFERLEVERLERRLRADVPEERLEPLEGGLLLVATRAAADPRRR